MYDTAAVYAKTLVSTSFFYHDGSTHVHITLMHQYYSVLHGHHECTLPGVRCGRLYPVLKLGTGFISVSQYNRLGRGWLVPQGPGR